MFNLDNEVRQWCRLVHPTGSDRETLIAELEDHLHCEIDRLVAEGYSEETAFQMATTQLGERSALQREYKKNRNRIVNAICGTESRIARWRRTISPKRAAVLHIVTALFFAASIMVSSWLLQDRQHAETARNILLAIYMIPFTLLCSPCSKRGHEDSSDAIEC